MKRVFILINGILVLPGDSQGWTDRGVTWLNTRTDAKAEKFEYASGVLTRRLSQRWRALAIARMCDYYRRAGYEISLVGHSNGCDLIARVIALTGHRFASVHLFAAAADWTPFALALHHDRIGALRLYVSQADTALRCARISRVLLGWAKLGYGSLGLGAPPAARTDPRITICECDTFGHSTWFERGHRFETTMRTLVAGESNLPLLQP